MIHDEPRMRIAIVGSGPSGCYSAQALRRVYPTAEICVFDALKTPYGLIRYGVAADHQGTKAIVRQFARQFEREDVRFFGGIEVGTHVSLDQLRAAFDIVVLAHGLHSDTPLETPGARDGSVYGAGRITRLLNGHPEESGPSPTLGASLAIIGHGNVAMDLGRLLLKRGEDFTGTDIDDEAHHALSCRLDTIHLIGRSAPDEAKFDIKMASEILDLPGVTHSYHGIGEDDGGPNSPRRELFSAAPRDVDRPRAHVHWWFRTSPVSVEREGTRIALALRTGEVQKSTIDVDSIISAIGFSADARQQLYPIDPAARESGRLERGLYVAGWARRGPRGTIPDQRADARSLAALISSDLPRAGGRPGIEALADEVVNASDYAAWLEIDRQERENAMPGRIRSKSRRG
ncbi:FAD-dependent oxidoreductase [Microbacterium foliorum]|uniref:FAD-dependent oxidoreductase n=1 Tax=Microbacterium foliorum TaxID=104336 RepID=UPI003735F2AB